MTDAVPAVRRFPDPNRFTVGVVGEPGNRLFYFQIFAEGVEVDLKCEKQQAVALAERVVGLLADLPVDEPVAPEDAEEAVEALPPAAIDWPVGSISIGIDWEKTRIVVVFEEMILVDDEEELPLDVPARVQIHLTPRQIHGFARQVAVLAGQSRPICPLCNQPIDPSGHACPRLN